MDHSSWIQNYCRVCGGKLSRYKVSYDCHRGSNQIKLQAIGVSVEGDREDIHPRRFCHRCYNACTRMVKARSSGKGYCPSLTKFEWSGHSNDNCLVCQHFLKSTRGRPKKPVPVGRPPDYLVRLCESLEERAPPSLQLDFATRERLSRHPALHELKCSFCHLVLDRPVNLVSCNQLVCLTCCIGYIHQHSDLSCPCCGSAHLIDSSTVIPAPPAIQKLLQGMEVQCERCKLPVLAGTSNTL